MLTIMGIAGREHGFGIDGTEVKITKIMAPDPRRVSGWCLNFFSLRIIIRRSRKKSSKGYQKHVR
jgi:hypothetical protein